LAIVATLALGSWPRQRGLWGCGPRGTPGSHITCSQEWKECEGMNPHTPKWIPMVGVGVPKGLPNFQSAIKGVKTPCPEVFSILLERY
jgi:hypothetical protein